jgi:hypothetical protein
MPDVMMCSTGSCGSLRKVLTYGGAPRAHDYKYPSGDNQWAGTANEPPHQHSHHGNNEAVQAPKVVFTMGCLN